MNQVFALCLILMHAMSGSSLIIGKFNEFLKSLKDTNIILSKGLNWQNYEKTPMPSNVKNDKDLETYGNYKGTFIEVCILSIN